MVQRIRTPSRPVGAGNKWAVENAEPRTFFWWQSHISVGKLLFFSDLVIGLTCSTGARRIVSTLWTLSRLNEKPLDKDSLLRSSMNVCDPTFGTRLKKITSLRARRVLFNASTSKSWRSSYWEKKHERRINHLDYVSHITEVSFYHYSIQRRNSFPGFETAH